MNTARASFLALAFALVALLSIASISYTLYKNVEVLSIRVTNIEEANKYLNNSMGEVFWKLEEMTTHIKKIDEKLAELENNIYNVNEDMRASIEEVKNSLEAALAGISKQVYRLAETITAMRNQVEVLQEKVIELENSDRVSSERINNIYQKLSELERQITDLAKRLDNLEQEVARLEEQAGENAGKITDLENQLSVIQSLLSSLEQAVATLQNVAKDLVERVEALESANATITGGGSTTTAVANETTTKMFKWLILVYMAADNNLEHYAIKDINEMEEVGSTSDVAVVVLVDRARGFDDSNGGWTGTRVYLVTRDNDPDTIGSRLLFDLGEQSTNDPRLLRWFVENMTAMFPAEHILLILWNHGAGILGGFAVDMDSSLGNKTMDVVEIANALRGLDIDIIGFDACLMGGYEVAYYLQSVGKVMVASADTEPVEGWPYKDILGYIAANPDADVAEVAARIVQLYGESLTEYNMPATLIALNLTSLQSVNEAIAALSYHTYTPEDVWALARAMDAAVMYPLSDQYMLFLMGVAQYGYIDLYNALAIAEQLATQYTRGVIEQLMGVLENAVIASYVGTESPEVLGLSAIGRESLYSMTAELYNKTLWEALATPWSSLVDKVDTILLQDHEPPRASANVVETPEGMEVNVKVESQDVSNLYLEIRDSRDNATLSIVLLAPSTGIEIGDEYIPVWLNGSESSYVWSGAVYQLVFSGTVYPSTVVIDTATGLGIVPGIYRGGPLDYAVPAVMFFNLSTGEPLYVVDAENALLVELTETSEFLPLLLTPMGWSHTSGFLPVEGLRLEQVAPSDLGAGLDVYLVAVDLAGNFAEELLYSTT
ncbi:clostripain-related cysteine peptidase [Pyrodictium delaneyi]|uniref:clostripain-related cysteine peptidase n=1 Tax=Pyrodictium delaneyi TaxID=1273541 RepID=UPI0018D05A28|nr:clostripain-related cysteine peptidase [Pyrodictium delaneyi]